jgi:hypothetical protein
MAVQGSIILNNMLAMCISENQAIPAELFGNQTFNYQAFNWNFAGNLG